MTINQLDFDCNINITQLKKEERRRKKAETKQLNSRTPKQREEKIFVVISRYRLTFTLARGRLLLTSQS